MKKSSGILYYVKDNKKIKVFIVHPSGDNLADWHYPKEQLEDGESILTAAKRAVSEECGFDEPKKIDMFYLGSSIYKNKKKTVHCYAVNGKQIVDKKPKLCWELDNYQWIDLDKAKELMHEGQKVFLDRLEGYLSI